VKFEVLIPFKIRANGEEVTLHPGQRIKIKKEVAERLLAEGRVRWVEEGKGIEGFPIRIYSRLLNDYLWLCWTEEEMKQLMAKGIKEAIYLPSEILILRNKSKEHLEVLHQVKKIFPGALAKA